MDGSDGAGAGESFLGCLAPKIKVWALLFSTVPYPLASTLSFSLSASLVVCHHSPTTLSHHSLPPFPTLQTQRAVLIY